MLIGQRNLTEIVKLLHIDEQPAAREVDGEFAAEEQCNVRAFSGEGCLNNAADDEIDRDRDIRVLLCEFVFDQLLDDKRLIAAEIDPDIDDVFLVGIDIGERGIILRKGADKGLEPEAELLKEV